MNAETLFFLLNFLAAFGWLLLIITPYSRLTGKLVLRPIIPAILALLYLSLIGIVLQRGVQVLDFSLMGLAEFATDPWVFVLGWAHVVCFDLMVGVWMATDARRRQIRHRWMIIPYLLTFMLGPIGLLVYLGMTQLARKSN